MPKSKPPRRARGVPQYKRDLQRADKPMSDYDEHKANAERWSKTHYDTLDEQARQKADIAGRQRARHAASKPGHGRLAMAAGGLAIGGALASRAHSTHVARDRKQSVGKGLVSIPLSQTSRGGAAGIKRLKGAAEEAAQATWKTKIGQSAGRMGKAAYAPTTPYEGALRLRRTLMQSKESGQRAKVQPFKAGMHGGDVPARGPMSEFNFGAGVKAHHSMMRQRGVSKAENVMTGTNVRRLTPRTPTGRFVSHENDLVYIQPRSFGSRRPSRDSKLQVWHKGKVTKGATLGDAKRFVKEGKRPIGRAEKERAAQASSPSLADTSRHTGARHGKRLV